MHKLISWMPALHSEAWWPLLAQADTVIEKGYNAVMNGGTQFGHSDDAAKFGIAIFALFVVVGLLAYLYVAGDRATIKELKAENKALREELKDINNRHERKYDELRDIYEKRTAGYFGTLQVAVAELAAMNKVMGAMGYHVQRPAVTLPPPTPIIEPPPRGQFLPPRQRRISQRPGGEPPDEQP